MRKQKHNVQKPTSDRSRKKKSHFAGFFRDKFAENRPIFAGVFGANHRKAIGKKTADFVVIFKANFARNRSVLR